MPERSVSNAEMADRLGIEESWIQERTGIQQRRIAGEESSLSLAAAAARAALERADVDPSDLDAVIVATITPDRRVPGTATVLAAELGAAEAFAFDLNAGCSGFLVSLNQADALIRSGGAEKILVCGVDLLSRITDYDDASSCVLFGDGAGAVVVQPSDSQTMGPFFLRSDGSRPELLRTKMPEDVLEMHGRDVYRHAVAEMTASVRRVVKEAGLTLDEVDLVIAHQANARILAAIAERLGLPSERFAMNIARVGNTSAASIPLALGDAAERGLLKDGDTTVITAFGAGFTWGAVVLPWSVASELKVETSEEVPVHA